MLDAVGNTVQVGDVVLYVDHERYGSTRNVLRMGEVTKVNAKTITILRGLGRGTLNRPSDQFFVHKVGAKVEN